jgi:tetratricopeptide (TPR) repeat protein
MTGPLLTAALIVRDEAAVLGDCLASLAGLAEEIVVVDTGSLDESAAIAADHGAVVLSAPWTGDFSAARNAGLGVARGAWILYIDADERVHTIPRAKLERRLAETPELAIRVALRPHRHATQYLEYRLWRNDPRIRFSGVMHERVTDAIHAVADADGRPIGDWPELMLEHVGYEGDQTAKHRRNLPLLQAQLAREPSNIFNWRHLSRVLGELGDGAGSLAAAEEAVRLALAEPHPTPVGGLALSELVRVRDRRGEDVGPLLAAARSRWPENWQLRFMEGQAALRAGDLTLAQTAFGELLAVDPDALALEIAYDRRIFGEWSLASLALVRFREGRFAAAAQLWGRAAGLAPGRKEYRVKESLARARAKQSGVGRCATGSSI